MDKLNIMIEHYNFRSKMSMCVTSADCEDNRNTRDLLIELKLLRDRVSKLEKVAIKARNVDTYEDFSQPVVDTDGRDYTEYNNARLELYDALNDLEGDHDKN